MIRQLSAYPDAEVWQVSDPASGTVHEADLSTLMLSEIWADDPEAQRSIALCVVLAWRHHVRHPTTNPAPTEQAFACALDVLGIPRDATSPVPVASDCRIVG